MSLLDKVSVVKTLREVRVPNANYTTLEDNWIFINQCHVHKVQSE